MTGDFDALEVYLESPPLPTVTDPLEHWNGLQNSAAHKDLAQMALDFLSVPGKHGHVHERFYTNILASYIHRC